MKFRAPTDAAIQLALTTGHTAYIPGRAEAPDGVELDKRFHKHAIAAGALPEGVADDDGDDGASATPTRSSVIKTALQQMLDGNEADDFKRDGTPDLNALSRRVGFKVSREEADALWAEVKQESVD